MKKFFLSEILYGVVLTFLFLLGHLQGGSVLESIELKFYDFRAKLRHPSESS